MRIGLDITALPPQPVGAGNYIIQLANALLRRPFCDELVIFVQRSCLPLLAAPGHAGVRIIPVANQPVPLRLAWEQVALPWWARRLKLDLLHSPHYTMPYLQPCRSVVTLHDMTFFLFPELHTLPKRLLFPHYLRLSARRADALISVSESTRQDAMRILSISPEKIRSIHLGVSPHFKPVQQPALLEQVREKYNLPRQFILYVGALEPRKNLGLLLDAFQDVQKRLTGWPLVVVGRLGWMYQEILDKLKQSDLVDKVQFIGYVPVEDLPVIFNLADLCVYPSAYEGFGLPPLEAMACGTPVITTNVSSMPEIVGEAGVLLPPGDRASLAQAIEALLGDPERRHHLSEMGLERAAGFTWERTAGQTIQLYQEVVDARHG